MKYFSSLLRAGLSPSRGCVVIRHASESGHPGVVPTNPGSGLGQASGTILKTGSRLPA
jgi:hypothetical protein